MERQNLSFCPVRDILSRIGDKWSMLVMMTIYHKQVVRFKELNREIPDLSQKVLTTTLRNLESDGYISRKVYVQIPLKVEYRVTDIGKSLVPHLEGLVVWAKEHGIGILKSREAN